MFGKQMKNRVRLLLLAVLVLVLAAPACGESKEVLDTESATQPAGVEVTEVATEPPTQPPPTEVPPTEVPPEDTPTPKPTDTLTPSLSPEELREKWETPLQLAAMMAAVFETLHDTANELEAGETGEMAGLGGMIAIGIFVEAANQGLSNWVPASGQEDFKNALQESVDTAQSVIEQWMGDEIDTAEMLSLVEDSFPASQQVLKDVMLAMRDDGMTAEDVSAVLEEFAQALDSEEVEELEEPTGAAVSTQAIEILSVNWYVSSIGSLHFIGELQNTGDVDLVYVEVIASLKDSGGKLVGVDSTYSELDVIRAEEKSPFAILFMDDPGEWAEYELNVEGEPADDFDLSRSYRDLEILDSSGKSGDFTAYRIIGQVRNIGDKDAEYVEIIATCYDAEGNVVAVDSTYSELDVLKAGQTSPFELLVLNASGDVDHYVLIVEGSPID